MLRFYLVSEKTKLKNSYEDVGRLSSQLKYYQSYLNQKHKKQFWFNNPENHPIITTKSFNSFNFYYELIYT